MPIRELQPGERIIRETQTEPAQPKVRELRPGEVVKSAPPPLEAAGRGANIGIARGFGAPVDLVGAGLRLLGLPIPEEPVGGSASIQRLMSRGGIAPAPGNPDPESLAKSIGETVGMGATMMIPGAGPAARLSAAVQSGTRAAPTTIGGQVIEQIGRSAAETPGRFMAGEVAAGAGAGIGGFVARQEYPDSPAAQALGEILGGVTAGGALATAGKVARYTPSVLGLRMARHFSKSGGQRRAAHRLQDSARDLEGAREAIRNPKAEEAGLTLSQRTGDPGILSLERSVIESSEKLHGEADEQIAAVVAQLRQAGSDFGGDVPVADAQDALRRARDEVIGLLETRARIAARTAEQRIDEIGPSVTRQQANEIAADEMQTALKAARQQERELWSAVPKDVPIEPASLRATFAKLMAETPEAQRGSIPSIAKRMLGGERPLKGTAREVWGLRSELLEVARRARAGSRPNMARIADELADAALDDLETRSGTLVGDVAGTLEIARAFSRDLNDRFTRGPVGKLLGYDTAGAHTTPAQLTLERSVGKGGPAGLVEEQALLRAMERNGNQPAMREAIVDYMRDEFQRKAVRDGRINPAAARTFMARHQDTLGELPELRKQFEQAISTDNAAVVAARRAVGAARRLGDPKVSKAAVFIEAPPGQALSRVAASRHPGKTMEELVKMARRDTSGDALKGLKSGHMDWLFERVSTGRTTASGDIIPSGAAMKRMLRESPSKEMTEALYSREELARINRIADALEKVELGATAKARPEGIIADNPSLLFSVAARVFGAQIGRKVATATGGGTVQTPGIISGLFQRTAEKMTQDPARRLLIDAMQDEQLFRALLMAPDSRRRIAYVKKQLNGWAADVIRENPDEATSDERE